jgi:hypothetical protein
VRASSSLPILTMLVPLVAVATLLTACGPPPEATPTPEGPLPGPTTPGRPTAPAPAPPPPAATGTVPDGSVAVDCDGRPGGADVLALLRGEDLLADDTEASVVEGPLCAADWQFTVVRVPDRDPLQVITSGPPDDLTLVTAGTDVCTIEVRVHAPAGIRTAAGCVG